MKAIGTVVLGGMITGTLLVVLFAPLFYVIIEETFGRHRRQSAPAGDTPQSSGEATI